MKQNSSPLIQLALILLAITVIIGGGFYFFNSYENLNTQKTNLQRENNTLENRIQVLSSTTGELAQYAETAYRSVPDANVGLFALNTIKKIVIDQSLLIDGVFVNASSNEVDGTRRTEIGFDVEGETAQVLDFLTRIAKTLPIVKLTEAETRVATDNFANSSITLEAYSKSLPEELPSIKEPLPAISESDKALLLELGEYEYPQIEELSEDSTTQGTFGKDNPFTPIESVVTE